MNRGMVVDQWKYVFREGPAALTETLLDAAINSPSDKAVIKLLVEHVAEQTKWIATARAELLGEAARVSELGTVMRKAGLRSYTDKEGRIYVVAENGGDPR